MVNNRKKFKGVLRAASGRKFISSINERREAIYAFIERKDIQLGKQQNLIIDNLIERPINSVTMRLELMIANPSARISDLKSHGFCITCNEGEVTLPDGVITTVCTYVLHVMEDK